MTSETLNTVAGKMIIQKTEKVLEENLSAFAHRFPVSGRVVHAVAGEVGGVLGLADRLEKQGLWPEVEQWMVTSKPTSLSSQAIGAVFGSSLIERMARHLDIPKESVEIQLALGVPKFFATLSADEDDEFGGRKRSKPRSRFGKNSEQRRSGIPPP